MNITHLETMEVEKPVSSPTKHITRNESFLLKGPVLGKPSGSFQNPGYLFPALTGSLEQLQNMYQFILIYFSFGTKAPSAWTLRCFRPHFNPGKIIPIGILTEVQSAQTACRLQHMKLNMKYLHRN